MIRYLFVLLLISCKTSALSLVLSGWVVDQNQQPVPYVHVGIEATVYGTVSDQKGFFTLILDQLNENQMIKFSCVGYNSENLTVSELQKNNIIILKPGIIQLPEFNFNKRKTRKQEESGYFRTQTLMKVNFAISNRENQNLGSGIAKKFKYNAEKNLLNELSFFIAYNNFDTVQLQIRVYELDKKGFPGIDLLNKQIIISLINRQKGLINIDLEQDKIILPKKCIISLEWISASKKGTVFGMPLAMPSFETHYYKFGAQNRWRKYKSMSNAIKVKTTAID